MPSDRFSFGALALRPASSLPSTTPESTTQDKPNQSSAKSPSTSPQASSVPKANHKKTTAGFSHDGLNFRFKNQKPPTSQSSAATSQPSAKTNTKPQDGVKKKKKEKKKSKRDRKKKAKARFIEEMKNAASRHLRAPPTREESITKALTTNGKLTYSGQSLIDKSLWDFEVGYADCMPFGSRSESAADAFCKCTLSEFCTWKAGLGAPSRATGKPRVAVLLRFYLEAFAGLLRGKSEVGE